MSCFHHIGDIYGCCYDEPERYMPMITPANQNGCSTLVMSTSFPFERRANQHSSHVRLPVYLGVLLSPAIYVQTFVFNCIVYSAHINSDSTQATYKPLCESQYSAYVIYISSFKQKIASKIRSEHELQNFRPNILKHIVLDDFSYSWSLYP